MAAIVLVVVVMVELLAVLPVVSQLRNMNTLTSRNNIFHLKVWWMMMVVLLMLLVLQLLLLMLVLSIMLIVGWRLGVELGLHEPGPDGTVLAVHVRLAHLAGRRVSEAEHLVRRGLHILPALLCHLPFLVHHLL